jgi:hypothetical protein
MRLWQFVRHPVKATKERAMAGLILKVLRYVIVFVGGGAFVVSDDKLTELSGLLAGLISLGFSIYKDYRDNQQKAQVRLVDRLNG